MRQSFWHDRRVTGTPQLPRNAAPWAERGWWIAGPGAPLSAAMIGALLRLLYGSGFVTHDTLWSLVWGGDMAAGETLSASGTTTPHVLPNLVGLLLLPFGSDADIALIVVQFWVAGGLVLVAGLLARELAGAAAGVAAAVLVATREQLVFATAAAAVDVWAALLVCWGLLLLARHRRAGHEGVPRSVMVMLLLAGLLRPEPWLLAAALWLWLVLRSRRAGDDRRWHLPNLALIFAAPLIWFVTDLVFTGDLLFSIHETARVNAAVGDEPSLAERLTGAPSVIVRAVGAELAVFAAVAGAWSVLLWRRRPPLTGADPAWLLTAVTAALLVAALLGESIVLGAAMYARFAVPIAVLVAVLAVAAVAEISQTVAPSRDPAAMIAAATAVLVLLHLPWVLDARSTLAAENERYWDARSHLKNRAPCARVEVEALANRVHVIFWTGIEPARVTVPSGAPVLPRPSDPGPAAATCQR